MMTPQDRTSYLVKGTAHTVVELARKYGAVIVVPDTHELNILRAVERSLGLSNVKMLVGNAKSVIDSDRLRGFKGAVFIWSKDVDKHEQYLATHLTGLKYGGRLDTDNYDANFGDLKTPTWRRAVFIEDRDATRNFDMLYGVNKLIVDRHFPGLLFPGEFMVYGLKQARHEKKIGTWYYICGRRTLMNSTWTDFVFSQLGFKALVDKRVVTL